MFVAINVESFIHPELFARSVDAVIANIKSMPSANGEAIYLPGEREFLMEEKMQAEGVLLEMDVVNELNELANRLGVATL